jgi:hypothetical protein
MQARKPFRIVEQRFQDFLVLDRFGDECKRPGIDALTRDSSVEMTAMGMCRVATSFFRRFSTPSIDVRKKQIEGDADGRAAASTPPGPAT